MDLGLSREDLSCRVDCRVFKMGAARGFSPSSTNGQFYICGPECVEGWPHKGGGASGGGSAPIHLLNRGLGAHPEGRVPL